MMIDNGNWMYVGQNPIKNWNPGKVEIEIEREEEE